MAISKTEIVNKALTMIGGSPITNLDTDSSNNARVVNRVYEIALKSILGECRWNFATKRALLAQSADTLAWYDTGETYIYQKPVDCIRVFGVNQDNIYWREEGEYIISDAVALGIRYVQYLDEPNKYPAYFVEAFTDKLCSDVAYAILNSATIGEAFLKKYEGVSLPKAMAENAQTGERQKFTDDAWEMARYNDISESA